jgi:hypothetical protein
MRARRCSSSASSARLKRDRDRRLRSCECLAWSLGRSNRFGFSSENASCLAIEINLSLCLTISLEVPARMAALTLSEVVRVPSSGVIDGNALSVSLCALVPMAWSASLNIAANENLYENQVAAAKSNDIVFSQGPGVQLRRRQLDRLDE